MIIGLLMTFLILPAEVSSGGPFSLQQEVTLPAESKQGGPFSLNGVVGQAAVGSSSGGVFSLHAGFHTPAGASNPEQEEIFSDGFE